MIDADETHQDSKDGSCLLEAIRQRNEELVKENSDLSSEVSRQSEVIASLRGDITEINKSRVWKLVRWIWTFEVRLRSLRGRFRLRRRVVFPYRVNWPKPKKKEHLTPPEELVVPAAKSESIVQILAPQFFDLDGNTVYVGGAERYLLELADVIREMGYDVEIYQGGNRNWIRYYCGLRVEAIYNKDAPQALCDRFLRKVKPKNLVIYSPFSMATEDASVPSIGISHGVFWDSPFYRPIHPYLRHPFRNVHILGAFSRLTRIVSVDTNTINWLRAAEYHLSNKSTYIPNFVDTALFQPARDNKKDPSKVVIVYPRRLYFPRGFTMVTEILPEFLETHPNVVFNFVGQADRENELIVQKLIDAYPEQIHWYSLPLDRMHEAYQAADIAVIPTINSEGTSLSCLEALASGNAVIATNVGGLPDLILDMYNGLLIEPNGHSLKEALHRLVTDKDLRDRLSQKGLEVARTFNLERWCSQWKQVLGELIPEKASLPDKRKQKIAIFPYSPGIPWHGIKQRPHHLARQLRQMGIETYWINPTREAADPTQDPYIIGLDDRVVAHRPFVILYNPYLYEEIKIYDDPYVIYDVLDDISIHDTGDGKKAREYHERLLKRADLVITSANTLFDKLKQVRQDVILVPNGVDLDHFSPRKVAKAPEMKSIPSPVIGFHGAFAEWIDINLLQEVAVSRPGYQFTFVGPVSVDVAALARLENVSFFESVPYEEIPGHIACFDVGILPFKINDVTNGVRPLKILEYFAMNKPVIATPIREILNWPGILLADTPAKFAEMIDRALRRETRILDDEEVRNFVKEASWEKACAPLRTKLFSF